MIKHSRWNEEHRKSCGECYQEWLDEMQAMSDEAIINQLESSEKSNEN